MPFFALAVIPYFAKLTKLTYFLVAKLGKLPLAKLQLFYRPTLCYIDSKEYVPEHN